MLRLVPDVMEGIMDIGPAIGDWEEFEQSSILRAAKVPIYGFDPEVSYRS